MTTFTRPDQAEALRLYLDLLAARPELAGDRPQLNLVTAPEVLAEHVERTGDALGLVLKSPYGLVLIDLVENNGYRFPYIRLVPPTSASSDGVVVIATTASSEVVMVDTFRHATGRTHLELPRGFKAADEDAVEAALRELKEETGYSGDGGTLLGTTFTDTGLSPTRVAFVHVTGAVPGEASPEVEEAIEQIHLVPLTGLTELANGQTLTDGFSLQALGLLASAGRI